MDDSIKVALPILPTGGIGGFHQEIVSAEVGDDTVVVSGGFGLGHTEMYVAVNGERRLTVDTKPMLRALIDTVLDVSDD